MGEHSILIIDNHEETRNLFSVNLKAYTNAEISTSKSIEEAKLILEVSRPDIIILRPKVDQRDLAKIVYEILDQKNELEKVFLITLGPSSLSHYHHQVLIDSTDIRSLVRLCANHLGITARFMADQEISPYYPIPLNSFLDGFVLTCPIYKRIDADIYKKILDKDHTIHKETLILLANEGFEEVYVESHMRLKFVSSLTVQIAEFLHNDNLSLKDQLGASSKGYELVKNAAKKMMIDPETMALADASMQSMMSIAERIPKLKDLIEMTLSDSMSLFYRHSLLVNYVSNHIIDNVDWGTRDQKVKAAFVAFFHDIKLDKEEFALIHSDKELELYEMTSEDRHHINRHALEAAKFISKYHQQLPFGVDTIIKQHHGSKTGIGFPRVSDDISPIAKVFIVAEEWVRIALKAEEAQKEVGREVIIKALHKKFKSTSFSPIIKSLYKLNI